MTRPLFFLLGSLGCATWAAPLPELLPPAAALAEGRCGGPSPTSSGPDRALRTKPTSNEFLRRADAGAYFFRRLGGKSFHAGVDLVPRSSYADKKDYRIMASGNGVVAFAANSTGYGYTVVIDHGNGEYSLSAHLAPAASRDCVRVGEDVVAGQVIGFLFDPATGEHASGNAGAPSGVHPVDRDQLHFELLGGLAPGKRARPGDKVGIFFQGPSRAELRNPTGQLERLGYPCSEAAARCVVPIPSGATEFDP